jgi:hypothetical protein
VDRGRIAVLRDLLGGTGWVERTRTFAQALRGAGHSPGGLLLVGTPQEEPWHLTAHLTDEAQFAGIPELAPTLVRWQPPADAPAHLAVGLQRLEQVSRRETVFVVAPNSPPEALLERAWDARKIGATVLAIGRDDDDLGEVAHEALAVPPDAQSSITVPDFELVSHLVSFAAGEPVPPRGMQGMRLKLARLLDTVSGSTPGGR